MAEVEYTTSAKLPVETIWDFVKDMDNWAPFLPGYQQHEKLDEDRSEWVLKGDVGSLTRTLKFSVNVSEWAGPERVTFVLKGLNEQMDGGGSFVMESYEDESAVAAPAPSPGFFARLFEAIARFLFRRAHETVDRGAAATAGPGAGMARLHFRLRLDPGGPMAPMINAMMKPAMIVAAEELANRIIAHLEGRDSGATPATES